MTDLDVPLPALRLLARGKVRDVYEVDATTLLLVASDRLSAYDVVLPTAVPDKGAVLTGLSHWWFAQLAYVVPNHLVDGPLPAGAGILGVAPGFGSQSLVRDFLSGVFILVEDQFGVGDIVDLDGQTSGVVDAVSLRTTRLRAVDGTMWHVPNGEVRRVGNKSQHWSRALIDVEVAYDTDLDHAE